LRMKKYKILMKWVPKCNHAAPASTQSSTYT
jgi:hypothetical protein